MSVSSGDPRAAQPQAAWQWTVEQYGQQGKASAEFSDWWRACTISPDASVCKGQFGAQFSGMNLNYSIEGTGTGDKVVLVNGASIVGPQLEPVDEVRLRSNFRQIRPIVDSDRPLRRVIEARDQCVASRGCTSRAR